MKPRALNNDQNHSVPLARDEWDFSNIQAAELLPALCWELRRESPHVDEIVATAKVWLAGKLSQRRPPVPRGKGNSRQRRLRKSSAAEIAALRARSVFDYFIPPHEFVFLDRWTLAQRRSKFDEWQAGHLKPLVENHHKPWQSLPHDERQRLAAVLEQSRLSNVVHIADWGEAIGHFKREKIDLGMPLCFSYHEHTNVMLNINWRVSTKRILEAISRVLKKLEPAEVKRWNRRGRKNRDLLVTLERLGMMRLLHHYTLSEIKLKLPDAWKLYEKRKWYDERRQALKDFRTRTHYSEPELYFLVSWQTKAQKSRNVEEPPTK